MSEKIYTKEIVEQMSEEEKEAKILEFFKASLAEPDPETRRAKIAQTMADGTLFGLSTETISKLYYQALAEQARSKSSSEPEGVVVVDVEPGQIIYTSQKELRKNGGAWHSGSAAGGGY